MKKNPNQTEKSNYKCEDHAHFLWPADTRTHELIVHSIGKMLKGIS